MTRITIFCLPYPYLKRGTTYFSSQFLDKLTLQCLEQNTMNTVLIVEDDPLNVRVFSKILTKLGGLAVIHTENVEEVIAIAQTGVVEIILMDVSLAHSTYQGKFVDGIKITQLLKANPMSAKLPIILVTAHSLSGDRKRFLKASGADEYITKPVVDQQQFVEKVLSFLP